MCCTKGPLALHRRGRPDGETQKRGSKAKAQKRLVPALSTMGAAVRKPVVPDVHLISLRPSLEGLIVPSKYYGIAAAGRAAIFVGDPNGEIAQAIRRSATGFAVCEGDGAGLVRAILALAEEPELAADQGVRARALFEAEFDFPHIIAAWEKMIEESTSGATKRAAR